MIIRRQALIVDKLSELGGIERIGKAAAGKGRVVKVEKRRHRLGTVLVFTIDMGHDDE